MILLGINCGFGQTDISSLHEKALDLEGGWVTFPRPKARSLRSSSCTCGDANNVLIDTEARPASAELKGFARKTPMQRNGTTADVAAAVLMFATAPHFITGQILAVDGGLGLM